MAGTLIKLTNAGRAALVGPGNVGTVTRTITQIGVATAAFVHNDNLVALPNELKKLTTFGGENVAPDTVHVTLRDDTADQYTLYGFGLYLDNGALLGTYSQDTPILEKSPAAMLLLSADMLFTTIDAALLQFGSAEWTNPPATEIRQGVVELATAAETQAGADASRAVTPAGLASRTATDTRTGLVELATDAETQTGTDTSRAVTPANLSSRIATESRSGLAAIASQAEANAAADDSKIITAKKMGAFVAAAVASLVNSAPGALDTLRELADAIGDDPNFATTMVNALALKAPLASPVLSGTPTAPTPSQFDTSTKIATMAALQRQGMQSADALLATGNMTLTAADSGKTVVGGSASAFLITLPLANSVPRGARLEFINMNAGAMTVQRQGASDVINTSTPRFNEILGNGDSLSLLSDGAGQWWAVSGTNQFAYAAKFGASLAVNGYQKLPSGQIVQWGTSPVIGPSSTAGITLPIAFPNVAYAAYLTPTAYAGGVVSNMKVTSLTLTGFAIPNYGSTNDQCFWWAVGK